MRNSKLKKGLIALLLACAAIFSTITPALPAFAAESETGEESTATPDYSAYIGAKIIEVYGTNYDPTVFELYTEPNGEHWTYTVTVTGEDDDGNVYDNANIAEAFDFIVEEVFESEDGVLWLYLDGALWEMFPDAEVGHWLKADTVRLDRVVVGSTGISVSGDGVPDRAALETKPVEDTFAVANAIIGLDNVPADSYKLYAYNIKLMQENVSVQPDGKVTLTLTNIVDPSLETPFVGIVHLLDTKEAIEAAIENGTARTSNDPAVVDAHPDEVAAAKGAGLEGAVVYTVLSSEDGDVTISEDGSIGFAVDSFSVFYVVAGTSDNGNNWYDTSIVELPGEASTYYVEPGTVIQFSSGTFSNVTTATGISRTNRTITIAANAAVGTTAVYQVNNYNLTFIVTERDDVIDGAILNHPVYLAILTSGGDGIPSEPGVSNGNYTRVSSTYGTGWNNTFANTAENIISKDIADKLIISVDGSSTVGVYDATGVATNRYLNGIDWNRIMDVAVSQRATATDGTRVTDNNRNNYVVIPYVIKLMAESGIGWHIDCVVVPATRITLSYDLNLKNYTVEQTLVLPNAVTGTNNISTAVGYIRSGNANLNVNGTLDATYNGVDYDVTFLGWSTDPNATTAQYVPGSDITVTSDTVLYAVWSGKPTTGTLEIKKTVTTADSSYSAPTDDEFVFTVTFNGTSALNYAIDGKAAGTINSGGTLKLKHGQTAVISDVPVGLYNVTETIPENYTMTSTGASGTISGDATSTATFINTYSKPTADLKIEKVFPAGADYSIDENQTFIFTVKGVEGTNTAAIDLTVTIHGEGQVTIKDLPVGNYIVTEKTDWSWRYEFNSWQFGSDSATTNGTTNNASLILGSEGNTITFTNTRDEEKWLDGDTYEDNLFDQN